MRIRLFHKLFLLIALASLASIVVFGLIAHGYMRASFKRYLTDELHQQAEAVAASVAAHYAETGSLAAFEEDHRRWRRLVHQSGHEREMAEPPRPGRRPGRRLGLYDAGKRTVVGPVAFAATAITAPVVVDGETVAWVGAPPVARPARPRDVRFADRQGRMLLIAAGVACLLSIVVAWEAARRIARPIQQIGSGARALAGGDFDTRLPAFGADEIGRLAEDFNLLARTLEQNDSARRRYFADIAHELRTPLSIMRGELEAVEDGVRAPDERLVASLAQEAGRLEQLVDDLYELARADIGALDYTFADCTLEDLVRQALERFALRFEQAGIEVRFSATARPAITGDAARLAQLFDNVFENCCRYAAPGQVRVTLDERKGRAEIVVEDQGPGLPESMYESIFEPLERAEGSRSRDAGGAGLGLAIARRIAEAHGGDMRAGRAAGGGLAVTVTLPLGGAA
ncbi:MAG: ATP-binding protein [Gammaproteobacteria bacterium]